MYTALLNEESVTARDCTDRTLDYLCPECRSQVILKRGKIKVPHFAHKKITGYIQDLNIIFLV